MNVFPAACANNRSSKTVHNLAAKENCARRRRTSLKYLIISCVNLTLSMQNFMCYYLQLVKPYAMFYRVSHKHCLMVKSQCCLLIICSFMYFTGVQCYHEKDMKYVHQHATNHSNNLFKSLFRVTKSLARKLKFFMYS